jgi:hypothetical protein
MKYTLITRNGRIMQFYVESVAQLYQSLNGGVVFTQQVLDEGLTIASDSDTMATY